MSNDTSIDFSELEKSINFTFKDKGLLRQAFVHRSYINENRDTVLDHNERLEFLGDAVLELVITDYLFRSYPKKPEGELTSLRAALVNTNMLAEVADEIRVNDFILLSKGESKDTGRARNYILADAVEALIGALYLDQGYERASEFIHHYIVPKTAEIIEKELWIDAKSRFQERAQADEGFTPEYKIVKESGPDHAKEFVSGVYLNDVCIGEGQGQSKQDAEQNAAADALRKKGWE